ncbi:serine/threonine-protein phosphatase 6 regulatory ankyrin repeat subunit B-like isoform X2 [Salmo trutta]|uniref:serine/threonine-protein phosphatase 6 regulatory ankyrin repeat subunit B-like isoform X2 n=1 Tax=Salmo trutta TaxID=8032 RepID=UPI001131E9CB|nr:serine/threonine-protein phosphatase 6 regulatory ankyrin repeat subunit B-like isoform X2 [Salmo trutta]
MTMYKRVRLKSNVSIMAEFETAITLLGSSLQDNEKRTPLHAATYLGDTEILELLILSGARVNAKDKCLNTLHRAVASCSEEAVQVLLKRSDVNARDKNWQTPLHVAPANKAVHCAEALVPQQCEHVGPGTRRCTMQRTPL